MDGASQGLPSPQSGNSSTSDPSTSSEQESKVTGQQDHRDITPTNGENLVARATAVAGKDEQLRKRSVSRRKYTLDEMAELGHKVEESLEAIRTFIRENGLKERQPELGCTLYEGYSTATQLLLIEMKQLLDTHFTNVNQIYQVLQSDYSAFRKLETTARRAVRSRRISESEQTLLKDIVSLGNSDKRHEDYWQERTRIELYANLCGIRFHKALKVIPQLHPLRENDRATFRHRIEDFLPQSIECMKMYQEVIQCQLGLEQYSKLEVSLDTHDRAVFGVAMLTDLAMEEYLLTDDLDKLRQMLASHSCCFSRWLADFDPEQPQVIKLNSFELRHLMSAMILTDNPIQAQRLIQFFRKEMEADNPAFAPKDALSVGISLLRSLPYLYDRPEPLAHFKARLEGARAVVAELETLIRTINKKKMLPEGVRATLMSIFEQVNNHYQFVIKSLHVREAEVVQRASDLIAEEQEEQQQIKEKLEARAKKRREREEQRQKAQWQKKQATQAATAEKKPPPPAPKPYDLAGTLNEATEAFARKEPVGVLNNIFKRVINHPQVTGFDKAQAHYSYADMVTSRLRRQLEFVHKMIEPVYAYGQALENQGPPDLEKDIKFREALKQFKLNMQQISIYTLVMSKAVKEAQEIFFSLNEDQPEFVDALVDLHNDMEHLIAQGKAVTQCCKDIPDIYARRGKMIQRHKLYRKSGSLRDHELKSGSQQHRDLQSDSERHRELSDRIKDLEELGKKLDKSMGMLKDALNSEQAAQVRQALSPHDSASMPECNNDSAQGSMSDQATSSMQTSPVATAAPSEGTHTTDLETPLVAGIEEAQEVKLPLKLLIPENMVIALGISIVERQLIALMKLFDSGTVQDKNLTTAKSRKGKKGKQQGRKGKDPVVPQPQATEVKKKNVDPDELGLKLQTRLSDYLEVLHDTGKTPDGKTVPEGLNLKVLLTRIQQGTFLEDSKYLGVDFTFLSDALKIPVQVNLPMNNMLYFRPGLVEPEKLDHSIHPEPHLHLELPTYAKENQWFASTEHYFQSGFEEDYQLFPEQPVKQAKPRKAEAKSKKGPGTTH